MTRHTSPPIDRSASAAILMHELLDADLFEESLAARRVIEVVLCTHRLDLFEEHCERSPVAVALVDISPPDHAVCELSRRLKSSGSVRTFVFLDRNYRGFRDKFARDLGAVYCCRNHSLAALTNAVIQLSMSGKLLEHTAESIRAAHMLHRFDDRTGQLTKREVQVWSLIAQGHSVSSCAELLNLAESTIDNHKSRLMKKLDIHKATQLARLAYKCGLVDPYL